MAVRYIYNPSSPSSQKQEESGIEWAGRNAISGLTSAASGLSQIPATALSLANKGGRALAELPLKVLPESAHKGYRDLAKLDVYNPIQEGLEHLASGNAVKSLVSKALPEGYLEPRSQEEETFQEFAHDIGSAMFPLGAPVKVARAIKAAGAGNLAKYFAKEVGASEGLQEGLKLGVSVLTNFGMQGSLLDRARDLPNSQMKTAREIERQVFEAEKTAARINNWLNDSKFSKIVSPATKYLSHIGLTGIAAHSGVVPALGAGVAREAVKYGAQKAKPHVVQGLAKSIHGVKNLFNSAPIRREYAAMIKNAANENAKYTIEHANKLGELIGKQVEKEDKSNNSTNVKYLYRG